MSDLTGTTNYETNEEGEVTGVRQGDGSIIKYSYDDFGNISQMTYPDGSKVSYTYDELDRLTSVTDVKGKKTTYSYNEAGDMTTIKRRDGTKSFLTYDKAHRVTELRHVDKKDKLISSYAYEYDDGGYITKETITQDGETLVQAYTYDTLGQVETMTVSDKAGKELTKLSYTYDLAGNKLTSTEEVDGKEETTSFTYDDANRLTKLENKDGTTTYTYDKNGNRISSETNDEKLAYIYDTENRLLAVKDKAGLLMAALYDGDDNRVFTASRKEGKHTYQLFQRQKKSPYTAPGGEEHSLFWYGFSQTVLQALSTLPQTIGTIWHDIFDDVSTAYHKKVAKDRANDEGLVVNPPDLGNLPGEGQVTYASQVKDVLIPYTTREDTFHYYEERNYVNDVNREHTEVLQTYDRELKAKETYTYGNGRSSYLNNETDKHYNYLTDQSGSVTGLTQGGNSVASSSYSLYGSTVETTDETGNPFAYNGEARDITGLDYLRARYYDSSAGTFLTEDSYQGELTTPLSQNRYSYVHNNPVNYTDPSGHRIHAMMDGGGGRRKNNLPKVYPVFPNGTSIIQQQQTLANPRAARGLVAVQTSFISRTKGYSYTPLPNVLRNPLKPSGSPVPYGMTPFQAATQAYLKAHLPPILNAYQQAVASGQSTFNWGQSKSREAANIDKNWTKALEATQKHVCDPKTAKGKDEEQSKKPKISVGQFREIEEATRHGLTVKQKKRIDKMTLEEYLNAPPMTAEENAYASKVKFKSFNQLQRSTVLPILVGELSGWNNAHRVWTGKDPITGKKANRWLASGELGIDFLTSIVPVAKAGKLTKVSKIADVVDDASDATKAAKAVDKVDGVGDVKKILTEEDIIFSDKFSKANYSSQVLDRGWNNQKIADTINNPVKTTSGYNKYTNSSVTNYYIDEIHYVAVDDSTKKVIQISDLNNPNWKGPR